MKKIIKSTNIVLKDCVFDGYLIIENGKIKEIKKELEEQDLMYESYVDYEDQYVMPGIFDTHNHGMMGFDLMTPELFMDDLCEENINKKIEILKNYTRCLLSVGVTSIFPTMTSASFYEAATKFVKEKHNGATIRGINSEGPWLNRVGENGVKEDPILPDLEICKQMVEHSHGLLKLVGIAPELPGAYDAIKYFKENNVRTAFTHSDCDYFQALDSYKQGISVITHTGNVMSGIHHRHMGGLGAALLDEDVMCEVICDGMHISMEMLKLYFKVKPYDKFMMISDNVAYAGMPKGKYKGFGENDRAYLNITDEGFILSDSGRLSGSSQPVIYGIKNLVTKLNVPIYKACLMSSYNPAHFYGFDNIGSIEKGKDADIIIVDHNFSVTNTYIKGQLLYEISNNIDLFNKDFYEAKHVSQ